ncbi:MAG: hypothetical protein K2X03_06965 [Bryobacteraceae bacterium]|nr:hypothetical protein [Bryobacteraceae bacterium]
MKPGGAYFALVFGAGFLLALIRIPLLVPRFGVRVAELLEMPVMLVVIWWAARWMVRRFAVPASARLRMGWVALACLITAELAVAVLSSGQSPAAYIASRDPVSGCIYLAMLLLFAWMPRLSG